MRALAGARRARRRRVAFVVQARLLWISVATHVFAMRRQLLVVFAAALALAVFSAAFIVSLARGKGSSLVRAA